MFGAVSDDARELQPIISLLRATLESTADGILVVDRDGRIVTTNRQFAVMWRIPPEVLTSRDDERAIAFVDHRRSSFVNTGRSRWDVTRRPDRLTRTQSFTPRSNRRGGDHRRRRHDLAAPRIDHHPHLASVRRSGSQHVHLAAAHRRADRREPGRANDGSDLVSGQHGWHDLRHAQRLCRGRHDGHQNG